MSNSKDEAKLLIAKINKELGENTIGFAKDLGYSSIERLSSGSLFLDYCLGTDTINKTSGWPMGRSIELYGPESSGKSLISLKTIVEAQKKGYICAYIDAENSFDIKFAEALGVDTSKLLLTRESRAGHAIDLACKILADYKDVKVIVFDSLASLIPEVELDASLEDQQMATMARIMSKGMRKLTVFNKNNTIIIFINQLRLNPGAGMYANPEYTPGGNALKYFSSIRVDVRKGEFIFDEKNKKKKLGQTVKFRIIKNKTDVPFKDGYFKFIYKDAKLDYIDELVSLGLLREKISRAGAYYALAEETFLGREAMEIKLTNDKLFFEKAKKEIFSEEKK